MTFPTHPTVHEIDPMAARSGQSHWNRAEAPNAERRTFKPFRTCSFCGSIHPEDLLNAFEGGAKVVGIDWRDNQPHLFVIDDIPHEFEDVPVARTGTYSDGYYVPGADSRMGKAWAKWHGSHFGDAGLAPGSFERLADFIAEQTRLQFVLGPKGEVRLFVIPEKSETDGEGAAEGDAETVEA